MSTPVEPDSSLADATATDLATAVRSGTLDPGEIVQDRLRRIRERDVELRAFVDVREEAALSEAACIGRRDDLHTLPLAGVPVAIKDIMDVEGLPTRLGSEAVGGSPAGADSELVRRLRNAGAIIVGKTALPELGIWATTDGAWGMTRNPRHPGRTPGGSSGGSAAAVAAGMVSLAIGTDGLGSIRIPAAACGIPGFKPGEGVVPDDLRGGDWHGMATTGPLANTVSDVALATAVLAGRPELTGADVDSPLLIALSIRSPLPGGIVDPEWAVAVRRVGEGLRRVGHHVVEDDPPYSPLQVLPVFARWFGGVAGAADALGQDLDWKGLQRRSRGHIRLGRAVHRLGGPRSGLKERWRTGVEAFFGGYDALITPALAHPPIRARRWSRRSWLANVRSNARFAPFAAPWNLAGTPAGSVPVGTHSDGTPLAVQVVAARGRDARVLATMRAVERVVAARR